MTQSRTHTCNELRLEHVGQKVKIVGWMENVREVGQNFAFVVVRDFYGTTQVVVETEDMMRVVKSINKESTISVEGIVRERDSKNPKQATGDVEVVPEKIEVLGRCRYNELPFEINRSREADETTRLKYRYLDLRNPAVKQNIILRCNVSEIHSNVMVSVQKQNMSIQYHPMVSLKDGHLAAETHCYDFSIYYNWDEYDPEYNPVHESEYDSECNPEHDSALNIKIAREQLSETDEVSYYLGLGMSLWYTGTEEYIEGRNLSLIHI